MAKIPYSTPFTPGAPISSAKAVRETCIPPKTEPMPRKATARTRTPGTDSADVRGSPGPPVPRGPLRGCVPRWAAKSSPPTRVSAASAISPAAGCTPVHSAVASTGPMTKVNSSVTDSKAAAVGSREEVLDEFFEETVREPVPGPASEPFCPDVPLSRAAQRDRTMGPICGTDAPVGTAATNSAHSGASASASTVSTAAAAVCVSTPGISTARCPNRSASLPLRGAKTAMETPVTAATAPALPYEPVVCWTSRTMPIVSIAKGCRAAKPGSRNVQAPGVRRSCP